VMWGPCPQVADNRCRVYGSHARCRGRPLAGFAGPVPGDDPPLHRLDAQAQIVYLIEQTRESLARLVGKRLGGEFAHPLVQITDPPPTLSRDDTELVQESA